MANSMVAAGKMNQTHFCSAGLSPGFTNSQICQKMMGIAKNHGADQSDLEDSVKNTSTGVRAMNWNLRRRPGDEQGQGRHVPEGEAPTDRDADQRRSDDAPAELREVFHQGHDFFVAARVRIRFRRPGSAGAIDRHRQGEPVIFAGIIRRMRKHHRMGRRMIFLLVLRHFFSRQRDRGRGLRRGSRPSRLISASPSPLLFPVGVPPGEGGGLPGSLSDCPPAVSVLRGPACRNDLPTHGMRGVSWRRMPADCPPYGF